MPRPIEALVHPDALARNLASARRRAPDARLVQERVTRIASAASPRALSEPRPY